MFKGNIVALITPMNKKGEICFQSLEKLVEYHIKNKTKAIVSVGTTGESSTLNKKEHFRVISETLKFSNNRIPIIAGTGANSTQEAIFLTKKFEKIGISACLSVTPYYNKPTQKGLYIHFKKIAQSTNIPQILYNVPSRTGCDLLPKTIFKLSKIENIIGVKEASGNLSRVNTLKQLILKKNFFILSGDDITSIDFMQLGGDGVISVTANILPKEIYKICSLCKKKDFLKARKINKKIINLHKLLFIEPNPIPVKWVAKKIKLIKSSHLRLPLTKLSNINQKIILKKLKKIKILKKKINYKK